MKNPMIKLVMHSMMATAFGFSAVGLVILSVSHAETSVKAIKAMAKK